MIPTFVWHFILFLVVAFVLQDTWNEVTFRYYQVPKLRYRQAVGILVVLTFAGGGFHLL